MVQRMASNFKEHLFLLTESVDSLQENCKLMSKSEADRKYSIYANDIVKAIEQVHLIQEKIISRELEVIKTTNTQENLDVKQKVLKLKDSLSLSKQKIKNLKNKEKSNSTCDFIGLKISHDQKLTNKDSDVVIALDDEGCDYVAPDKGTNTFNEKNDVGFIALEKHSPGCDNENYSASCKDNDIDSDDTDDLENFDDFDLDYDECSKATSSTPGKIEGEKSSECAASSSGVAVEDNFDESGDIFSDDDDFDESALQELDAAEKSYAEHADDTPTDVEIIEINDDEENQPQDKKYLQVLKQYFGYSKFRPMQWKILHSVMVEKRDNCVVMATGYGKSLCYQFPSLMTDRTTVVISPLISLMQDQVLGLQAANIPSCYLGSAQENSAEVKDNLLRGEYRVLYLTPEFAAVGTDILGTLNKCVGIDLIAIDEAHCVSQWGHDFRDSYRKLGQLRSFFPDVPIMALTATATPEVTSDICKSLKLKNPAITCTGFDRPNLYLSVSNKSGDIKHDLQTQMLVSDGKYQFPGPTIIYCPTKKITDTVAAVVKAMKVPCLPYHAGLSPNARKEAHKKFVNDEIQVVVATVAFGMGIDKPDCRKVIHYGAPKDIESYYQEIGRAGRDGLPGFCHTFYINADFTTARFFLKDIQNLKFKQHKASMLSKMQQYLSTSKCRRRILLSHFDKRNVDQVGGTENCCDNCRTIIEISRQQSFYDSKNWSSVSSKLASRMQPVDYRKEAQDFFTVVEGINGGFGLINTVLVLTGSSSQKVKKFSAHKIFGIGRYKKISWWKAFGKCLVDEGYLDEVVFSGVNAFGSTIQTSKKARDWLDNGGLHGNKELKFVPNTELEAEEKSMAHVSLRPNVPTVSHKSPPDHTLRKVLSSPVSKVGLMPNLEIAFTKHTPQKPKVDERTAKLEADLYSKLILQRNELALETGYTPHSIASNKVLLDMAKVRPSTKAGLLKLEDFPEAKVEKFGLPFLEIIVDYCKENDLKTDNCPEVFVDKNSGDFQSEIYSLTETQRQSYIMFTVHNNSTEEVASRRGLKTSTVVSHLAEAIRVGLPVNVELLGVTTHIQKLITNAIRGDVIKSDISRLSKIKDTLPDYIEYNHIKVVIALLVRQYGQIVMETGETVLQGSQSSLTDSQSELNDEYGSSQSEPDTSSTGWNSTGSQPQSSSKPSGGTKRKLPGWMSASGGNKPVMQKRMKSNSLFR